MTARERVVPMKRIWEKLISVVIGVIPRRAREKKIRTIS
jgi:hypothetical protein